MQRRDFMKKALIGSLCLGYESSHAFGLGDLTNFTDEAATVAQSFMLGEKEEIQIGETQYKKNIQKSGGLYPEQNLQKAISSFSKPLIDTTERKNLPWEIVLVKNDSVNAWAMPGGKMAVFSGLVKHTTSPEELASVIAHEIGHAEKSHSIDQIQNQAIIQSAGSAIKKALAEFGVGGMTSQILATLEAPVYQMILSGYSRENEFEADSHILHVFEKVGMDSSKADDFFVTLDQLYPSDSTATTSLFSTHPVTKDRIAAIRKASEKKNYEITPSDYPGWNQLKAAMG